MSAPSFSRVEVVGTSGSGKSTLARALSTGLGLARIELDALHWGPEWTEADPELLRARVEEAVRADRWVVDGNCPQVRDLVWPRAEAVVWLDYARPVVMRRVVWRTLVRAARREVLWSGNTESLRRAMGPDSIVAWAWTSYDRVRERYERQLLGPERMGHLAVVHHRSPRETERWLRGITA